MAQKEVQLVQTSSGFSLFEVANMSNEVNEAHGDEEFLALAWKLGWAGPEGPEELIEAYDWLFDHDGDIFSIDVE